MYHQNDNFITFLQNGYKISSIKWKPNYFIFNNGEEGVSDSEGKTLTVDEIRPIYRQIIDSPHMFYVEELDKRDK